MVKNYKEKHEFPVVHGPEGYRVEGLDSFRRSVNGHKRSVALAESAFAFLEKGLNEGQIKMGRPTSISFLSWRKTPSKPEFYDWIDFEHHEPKKKGK
jgi:hypothetical protein